MYTWFENGHLHEIFIPTHIHSFWISVKKKLDACLQNNHLNEIFIYSSLSLHVCFNTPVYQFIYSSFYITENYPCFHCTYNPEQFFDQAWYYFAEYLDCTYYTLYFNAILWYFIQFLSICYAIDSSKYYYIVWVDLVASSWSIFQGNCYMYIVDKI